MSARRVKLPKTARLLASACNPCMDVTALVCLDSVPASASVGPPGLTPAQLAMRQKMLAFQARRLGVANPAAAQRTASGIRHGPQIKLALWRTGKELSQIWEVDVVLPKPLFSTEAREGTETARVTQLCWSPNGTCRRLTQASALLCACLRREMTSTRRPCSSTP